MSHPIIIKMLAGGKSSGRQMSHSIIIKELAGGKSPGRQMSREKEVREAKVRGANGTDITMREAKVPE